MALVVGYKVELTRNPNFGMCLLPRNLLLFVRCVWLREWDVQVRKAEAAASIEEVDAKMVTLQRLQRMLQVRPS